MRRVDGAGDGEACLSVIRKWQGGSVYKTAVVADSYDRQENDTIKNFIKKIFTLSGLEVEDFTASNNKIVSNFFRRLNVQRNTYLLGNGVSFPEKDTKDKFGAKFDEAVFDAGYHALIHGISFVYWNERANVFKATEFAPLWDEETGALRAGVRFWQLDADKPLHMVLYEADGYTKFRKGKDSGVELAADKQAYVVKVQKTEADGEEVVGAYNYSMLPVFPLWGSSLRQSTLVGMRSKIDSYDLIRSGFANDLSDVAEVFFLLENYGGMRDEDVAKFRDRLKLTHIAAVDTSSGGKVTPYVQNIPFEARKAYLDDLRVSIYEDFGAFDVKQMSGAAKTATEIQAAYQPLDEEADDYEKQIIGLVQSVGAMLGLDTEAATPQFKRNRVSNQAEQVELLMLEAEYLDEETILKKLPNIEPDEIEEILRRRAQEDKDRFMSENIDETETDDGVQE